MLLGGGTLVGKRGWLKRFLAVADTFPASPRFTLGVGVEDPDFEGSDLMMGEGLRPWRSLLGTFSRISVRGPRSKALLDSLGVPLTVVGDPALALCAAPASDAKPIIGVNLGIHRATWGGDPERVLTTLASALDHLQGKGWRIRAFSLNRADDDYLRKLCKELGGDVEICPASTVEAALQAISECAVVVGQRLHAVVLASALRVPTLAVEYQPKLRDFQDSIDRGVYTVRTDSINRATLVDLLEDLLSSRDDHAQAIDREVSRLVAQLTREARAIAALALHRA